MPETDGAAAEYDPVGFVGALRRASVSLAGQPFPLARSTLDYCGGSARALWASALRAAGVQVHGPAELSSVSSSARRHTDPGYTSNAWFYLCRQQHALFADYLAALAEHADLDPDTRRRVDFLVRQVVEAAAPANFPAGNPEVLRRAFDTGGASLLRGLGNMARDVATNNGRPRQVTPGRLRVGTDLACTAGTVVYRNRLIELIQYRPRTATVNQVPMLFSPPWINKYYIMDLAPGRSLVEWAVEHGHTCFAISYRNPDEGMRDLGMADYLREGPLAALDVIQEITGAPSVNAVALCLGGTLITAAAAWLAARGEHRIHSLTLLNTLLDFTEPGPLGVFTDQVTARNLAPRMRRDGYLPAEHMRTAFDLLRPSDLVWNYLVNDWLLGEEPPPSDLLAWNHDATRMPEAMHTEYLQRCYRRNQLALGRLELAGQRLDLGEVRHDSYLVTAECDHIAPWRSVYAGARLLGGPVRFVLSNAGHVAGVVNPPGPRSVYCSDEGGELPEDPSLWHRAAVRHPASWWEDWARWVAERAGASRLPPAMGSAAYPPLRDAPGDYVFG